MKEVTKEQFYDTINQKKLDLVVSTIGNYPFTNEYKFRNGVVWGKVVPTERDPKEYKYPFHKNRYYIL